MNMNAPHGDRDYQRYMVMAINAERAAQGLTMKALAERAGLVERTMLRVMNLQRDMDLAQVAAIARALGVKVSTLVAEAERRATFATPVTQLGRKDIEGFLASPGSDPTLNTQLSEAREVSGVSGFELTQLLERIERLRRDELLQLLGDLDRANRNHGAS